MSLFYEKSGVAVHHGDCLTVLPTLASDSVDAVITDPPYSSGGLFRGDRAVDPTTKLVCDHEVVNFHPTFTGDNKDQRAYFLWCNLWLSECRRVLKTGGVICLFTDWRQLPVTTDALQIGGFIWRGVVVWDKTEGARPNMGRFKQQAEFVVWGSNGPMSEREEVGCLNGVFRFAPFSGKKHIAGKPEGLMREIVRICPPNGTVLDPFAGSGTTLLAAKELGCRAIGVEIEEGWCSVAARRLQQGFFDFGAPTPTEQESEEASA